MVKKILLSIFFLVIVVSKVFAYSNMSLEDIEMFQYGQIYENENFLSRLDRLEKDMLGMEQSGSIESRLNNLTKISANRVQNPAILFDNYQHPQERTSAIKRFFNNVSASFSDDETITGFTPDLGSMGTSSSTYSNNYNYCPYHRNYNSSYYNPFRKNFYNRNKIGKYFSRYNNRMSHYNHHPRHYNHMGFNGPFNSFHAPYGINQPYQGNMIPPMDVNSSFSTRSSIRMLD